MKRLNCIIICLLLSVATSAQTQQGIVKTRGRMVNGKLQPGKGLADATVDLKDRSAVISKDDGTFSFPLRTKTYLVKKVTKKGYQLVDMEALRERQYSADPVYLVMETPEQLLADQLAQEKKQRRQLQKRIQQREDEIENLNVTLEEKNRLLQELNKEREDNEKIVKDLAQYYSTLDYEQLNDFQRQVSNYLENYELEKADSMLRSRGNMSDRIREIQNEQKAEEKEEKELAKRQENLEASKAGTKRKIEDVAEDCFYYYRRFLLDHQNDSAAYYLELRATLDTTYLEWQIQAGRFVDTYLADYEKARFYYERCLKQALLQGGENNEWVATSYNSIGAVYDSQGDYPKALEYYQKALDIYERVLDKDHPDVATSYNNIGAVYKSQGDNPKALEYYKKALDIFKKLLGVEHPQTKSVQEKIMSVKGKCEEN